MLQILFLLKVLFIQDNTEVDFGRLFLGLMTLWDSISVYIGSSPKERAKEKRKDRLE